jgi:glycosyltransferase involved in cell wall biosynthesis
VGSDVGMSLNAVDPPLTPPRRGIAVRNGGGFLPIPTPVSPSQEGSSRLRVKYSVIIPSYNAEATIVRCLRAITQQRFGEPYEVIVVDSSIDATPEIIRQHFPACFVSVRGDPSASSGLKALVEPRTLTLRQAQGERKMKHAHFPQMTCLHFPTRTDAGTARNIGVQHAQGELVCFLDADCIADPEWLANMVAAHHSDYAAVGGAILNGNPENLVGWVGYLAEFREFFPFHPKQVVRHVASCNIAYKRWVFDRYGGFPAEYYPQEDLVFNLQLSQQGGVILFDPTIKVAHLNKTSLKHFCSHQYRIGRITALVLKHFPVLPGAVIARSPLLATLAAPVLPCVKFLNTGRVAMRSQEYGLHFLCVAPLLFVGLLIWGIGFVRGVLGRRQC